MVSRGTILSLGVAMSDWYSYLTGSCMYVELELTCRWRHRSDLLVRHFLDPNSPSSLQCSAHSAGLLSAHQKQRRLQTVLALSTVYEGSLLRTRVAAGDVRGPEFDRRMRCPAKARRLGFRHVRKCQRVDRDVAAYPFPRQFGRHAVDNRHELLGRVSCDPIVLALGSPFALCGRRAPLSMELK